MAPYIGLHYLANLNAGSAAYVDFFIALLDINFYTVVVVQSQRGHHQGAVGDHATAVLRSLFESLAPGAWRHSKSALEQLAQGCRSAKACDLCNTFYRLIATLQ